MHRKSTQIALGGMFSALCLLFMFMTGMIPFSVYALPALAGAMLIAVVVENGAKTAVLVYVSVAFLSLFISPDREAAVMFIVFFGYYPVLKCKLEKLRPRLLEYGVKLIVFAGSMLAGYWLVIHALGLTEVAEDMGSWGRYGLWGMLAAGCVVFLIYDYALSRYISLYVRWFRPTFLRK